MTSNQEHLCSECGHRSGKWFGRCPQCGVWNSCVKPVAGGMKDPPVITTLDACGPPPERTSTGLEEVDRVLGGGLVEGSVLLLAGEPGIGKSTLVLQMLHGVSMSGGTTLLATGEESISQVALRAERLDLQGRRLPAAATTSLEEIMAATEKLRPDLLVVDSIQTLSSSETDGIQGSISQVRSCAARVVEHAKSTGTAVVFVGHVTKDGNVAGPKSLEHVVDVVLALEGDRSGTLRFLRSAKNRFGSVNETGVFCMLESGLRAVRDPSALLLSDRRSGVPGSVVFPSLEGTRPLLVEIQALVSPTDRVVDRRTAIGFDSKRLSLILAVLERRAGLRLCDREIFVAAAGGVAVREPAADLAVATALASVYAERAVPAEVVVLGEVGLGGEVRRTPGMERRLSEAARLGFRKAISPPTNAPPPPGLLVDEVADVNEALSALTSAPARAASR